MFRLACSSTPPLSGRYPTPPSLSRPRPHPEHGPRPLRDYVTGVPFVAIFTDFPRRPVGRSTGYDREALGFARDGDCEPEVFFCASLRIWRSRQCCAMATRSISERWAIVAAVASSLAPHTCRMPLPPAKREATRDLMPSKRECDLRLSQVPVVGTHLRDPVLQLAEFCP